MLTLDAMNAKLDELLKGQAMLYAALNDAVEGGTSGRREVLGRLDAIGAVLAEILSYGQPKRRKGKRK